MVLFCAKTVKANTTEFLFLRYFLDLIINAPSYNSHTNVILFFLLGPLEVPQKVTLFAIVSSSVICSCTVGFGSNTGTSPM